MAYWGRLRCRFLRRALEACAAGACAAEVGCGGVFGCWACGFGAAAVWIRQGCGRVLIPWDSGESMGGSGRRFRDLDLAVLPESLAACFGAGGLG